MNNITITSPTLNDVDQMIAWGTSNWELWLHDQSDWHSKKGIKDLIKNPKNDIILVAKVDGKLAGMCIVYSLREWAYCSTLFVDKPFRKLGIGKMLINKAASQLKKQGINNLHLVAHQPSPAIDFYKHVGFKQGFTFAWIYRHF